MKKLRFSKFIAFLIVFSMLFTQLGMTVFAENKTKSFSDTKGHYAESVINQWVGNGFINGYPDGTFKPGENVTRAQFVALLNRAFKLESTTGMSKTFSDVTKDKWYYNDVMLATSNRIIEGYNNQFRPEDPITREDASVIISRYLELSEAFDPTKLNSLSDKDNISDYAVDHVAAMTELNVITTKTGKTFDPKVAITRADTVVWLNNAYNMAKGESGITGKIYANNKALANATVIIEKQNDYKATATLKTNDYGAYSTKLPAGTYNVIATKDNMVAFESEIVVRSNFKSIVRFSVEEGQVVTATLNDVNGDVLTGTTIYFKTNPYFPVKSDSNGNISAVLPKNRDYEAFYAKDSKLLSIKKFSTKGRTGTYALGNINTSLGEPRSYGNNNSSSSSNNSGDSGNNDSNWNPSYPYYPPYPTPIPTPNDPEPDNPTPGPNPNSDDLPDYIKNMLGLDNTKDDNDGDGLKDFFEYAYLTTDTLLVDTDGNGISDADEDFDGDGLTNIREQTLGTRPDMLDTDDDGLSDYDEVNVHGTNPLSPDTDGDGLTDTEEIKLGLNPNNSKTDGNTLDRERTFVQVTDNSVMDDALRNSDKWLSPSISGNVPGDISKNIVLEKSLIDAFNDNRSVLSDVIDVFTSYDENHLKLSFSYNEAYTGNINNLTLVSFGESGLELIDTVLDETGKMLSGEIAGDGTYFIIDLDEFLKGLGIDVFANINSTPNEFAMSGFGIEFDVVVPAIDVPTENDNESEYEYYYNNEGRIIDKKLILPEKTDETEYDFFSTPFVSNSSAALSAAMAYNATGKADIVFVLDTTASMDDDILRVANNINAFVDSLVTNYNIDANFALITYNDIINVPNSTKIHKNNSSNWFTNVNAFKSEVTRTAYYDVGDGWDETPLDGLGLAKTLDWRQNSARFVVLLTDEWSSQYNTYGYPNITALANAFAVDNICVSVITEPGLQNYYKVLWETTNGLYASIFSNFSDLLLGLAEKVGDITNTDGEWVFLSDFQAVKLSSSLANSSSNDTDDDGLTDAQELGSSVELNMLKYITSLTNKHSIPIEYYTGKTELTVWNYLSNPILLDTDYDGISDGNKDYDGSLGNIPDVSPKRATSAKEKNSVKDGNSFSGTLNANDFTFNVSFNVDYSLFFDSNKDYKDELAVLGAIYSTIAYHTDLTVTNGASFSGSSKKIFESFGLKNFENYKLADYFNDDDISEMSIGHREVNYKGFTKDIIVVAVRGTDATIEEWSSNFDVGADISDYWDKNNSYWRNKNNHKGFDVAANRLYDEILRYVENLNSRTSKTIYIVGHSRGAAIANILGAKFEDNAAFQSFIYTFATPMTTTAKGSYNTIFNIVNKDDIVPYLPLSSWGFDKYGKTYEVSIKSQYENKWGKAQEGTWEAVFNVDYNYNGNKDDTVRKFNDAAKSRNEVYTFSNDNKTIYTYDTKYNTKDEATDAAYAQMVKYGNRISKFCEFYVTENDPLIGKTTYQVSIKQTPAAFMMILTDVVASQYHDKSNGKDEIKNYGTRGAGEDKWLGQEIGFYVAKKYSAAKSSFVWSGADSASDIAAWVRIGGMVHSHMPGSYYFLAYDYKNLIPTK